MWCVINVKTGEIIGMYKQLNTASRVFNKILKTAGHAIMVNPSIMTGV